MTTKAKTLNRITQLKESLESSKTRYVLSICCEFSGLVVTIFAYRPVIAQLHSRSTRLGEVETELLNQHSAIAALGKTDLKDRLMHGQETPLVIDELIEKGEHFGLHFSSITPSELYETTHAGIRKLPIKFTIESEYENLGQFLAYVEGSSPRITEVESLSIRPQENDPFKSSMELILNLYVETKDETK